MFIAEHENSPSKDWIQYDAWKLLSVEARCRVLVAYWGKGKLATFDALKSAVAEVCIDHPRKRILLIGGRMDASPKDATEFRSAHKTAVVTAKDRA